MREYGARSTVPNVEDFGEAQLSGGRAFVPIDARFGDAIDHRSTYLVFVTPEGESFGGVTTQLRVSSASRRLLDLLRRTVKILAAL